MARNRYVALLRGINVGGRNKVAMADLRAAFTRGGFESVSTYIQSGNVLFSSDHPRDQIEAEVEQLLARVLELPVVVVVRSRRQLRAVVADAPDGFGTQPEVFHSDVVFLKAPLTSRAAMSAVELRAGVDEAWPGTGVVYFQRLSARRAQSRLANLAARPEYQRMTVRNWNTTTKLLGLLERAS